MVMSLALEEIPVETNTAQPPTPCPTSPAPSTVGSASGSSDDPVLWWPSMLLCFVFGVSRKRFVPEVLSLGDSKDP